MCYLSEGMAVNCTKRDIWIFLLVCVLFLSYHAYYNGRCQSPCEKRRQPLPSTYSRLVGITEASVLNTSEWYVACLGDRKESDSLQVGLNDVAILKEFPPLDKIDILVKQAFLRLSPEKANAFCANASLILKEESYWSLTVTERWKFALKIFATVGIRQRLPDVIGIGVKKSGSSALRLYLAHHPNIRLPDIYSEAHYFDWKYFMSNKESYMAMMPLLAEDEICYEKTPRYFVTSTAPTNIARDVSPRTKFVICIRDPVKRALSDWHHEQTLLIQRKNFSCVGCTALSEGIRFTEKILTKNGEVDSQSEFIDTSNYARHFEEWLQVFPFSQFFILKEEDIRNNPLPTLQKLEKFLGVPRYYKQEMFVYNSTMNATCFYEDDHELISCLRLQNALPHPEPNETVIKKMRDFFRPHNKRFEELTGMKFEWTDL